jgi:hypothetical protein
MRFKLRALALALVLCALGSTARAQSYIRVTSCGDAKPPAGASSGYQDVDGKICTSATGGGGGGAVTVANGADETQGAIADAAASAGGTGTVSAKLREATALLNSILTSVGAAIPAGTNVIGKVSVDQTTPGTTNAVSTSPNSRTLVTLDVKTVTTGGTAVTALTSAHKSAGGWIQNPPTATVNLCINEIGTATGTTSSGDTTCIIPGQTYNLVPSSGAVSVISSDSSHPFSGYGLN